MEDSFERAARQELDAPMTLWRIHFGVYLAIQLLLVATWWMTSDGGAVMPWFIFPMFGWGAGVVAHYLAARSAVRGTRP